MAVHYLAVSYGNNKYNASSYGGTGTTTSTGTGDPSGSGLLANTGFDVLIAVTLACVIIFVALAVRLGRRKAMPTPTEVE